MTIDVTSCAEELACANRILFQQQVLDAFGHVSLRHPMRPDTFMLARSMAPGRVTPDDIMLLDFDGQPVGGDTRSAYLERFIHAAILRARPDVVAVVHSHAPALLPFGVVRGACLRAMCHMAGFLAEAVPTFEIRDVAGDASDLLIRDRQLGEALARRLGSHAAVLMRGHGATVVGGTLREAVFRAVYTVVNARLQSEAMRMGSVTYLTAAEAGAAEQSNRGQIDRAWDLWAEQAEKMAGGTHG